MKENILVYIVMGIMAIGIGGMLVADLQPHDYDGKWIERAQLMVGKQYQDWSAYQEQIMMEGR